MVARFNQVKSDSILLERQSGQREGSGCLGVFGKLLYVSLGLEKNRLSFKLSNVFPGFSWARVCALHLPNLFLGFLGALCPFLVCVHHFGCYSTCAQ